MGHYIFSLKLKKKKIEVALFLLCESVLKEQGYLVILKTHFSATRGIE